MKKEERNKYLEEITHVTRTSPYSIHKSCFNKKGSTALYLHLHPEMELLYLEKGRLSFKVEEEIYRMQEGEAIWIPQNMLHTATAESEEGIFRAICFAPEYLMAAMEQHDFGKYVHPIMKSGIDYTLLLKGDNWQSKVLALLNDLFYQSEEMKNSELLIRGYLLVIWNYLYHFHIVRLLGEREKGRNEEYLEEVLAFIHAHYREDLSLAELADVAHMSEGQFCRCFKKAMGNTPFTYLKRYRILKCCVYLSETDKKISEICSLCGFNNISYFNREFMQVMKTTPSKYRMETKRYKDNAGDAVF